MPITLKDIRGLASFLYPELSFIIAHESEITRSTWTTDFETGKAVEFVSLCALAAAVARLGGQVSIPKIYLEQPDLFYLRNIIHKHHGAQAGHNAIIDRIPLKDRFIAALTPRLTIKAADNFYGIYREGFPIHLIQMLSRGNPEYLDRPDIILAQGTIEIVDKAQGEIEFSYKCSAGTCEGSLRVKNDINVPIKSYNDGMLASGIPIMGIIECSVGKSKERADEQLNRYIALFGNRSRPASLLINGHKKPCPAYDFEAAIDLKQGSPEALRTVLLESLTAFSKKALAL